MRTCDLLNDDELGDTPFGRLFVGQDHCGRPAVIIDHWAKGETQIDQFRPGRHPLQSLFGRRPGESDMLTRFRNEREQAERRRLQEENDEHSNEVAAAMQAVVNKHGVDGEDTFDFMFRGRK